MAFKKLPEADYLRKLFGYAPETGRLYWLPAARLRNGKHHPHAGKMAGNPNKDGYRIVVVDGVKYRAHRIIWALVTGEDSPHDIDHRNGDPRDNTWKNLRAANHAENMRNMRRHRDNKSGFKGVDYVGKAKGRPWRASIYIEGSLRHLGFFATAPDAHNAYCLAAKQHFGEFFTPG